jgi:hypothetical protein
MPLTGIEVGLAADAAARTKLPADFFSLRF